MRTAPLLALSLLTLTACGTPKVTYQTGQSDPAQSESNTPGIALGAQAPDAPLLDADSAEVSLASLYAQGPTILVFYRGGWCTYCNLTLAEWARRADEVNAAGARVIAISPEKPTRASEYEESPTDGITIYADAQQLAAEGFDVLDDLGLFDRSAYSIAGIELDEWNESGDWALPLAATFVIDRDGVVRYRYASKDHTKRADPDDVLAAVRSLQ